jgi:hypothetical protein
MKRLNLLTSLHNIPYCTHPEMLLLAKTYCSLRHNIGQFLNPPNAINQAENSMNPMDILNLLFQYSLLHLYTPIVNTVGFSHPLTFTIIAAHNTLSLTYLLLIAAIAYPAFHQKTWFIPAVVAVVWTMISISVIMTLHIPATTAFAAVLPHGWLEFAAIGYWTNAIRKATQASNMPTCDTPPTIREYLGTVANPKKLAALVKTDVRISFKAAKLSLSTLCGNLKRPYLTTLLLIVIAALIETYITPVMILLVQ